MDSPTLQLETLFVKIMADYAGLLNAINPVKEAVRQIENSLTSLTTTSTNMDKAATQAAKSVDVNLSKSFQKTTADANQLNEAIEKVNRNIKYMGSLTVMKGPGPTTAMGAVTEQVARDVMGTLAVNKAAKEMVDGFNNRLGVPLGNRAGFPLAVNKAMAGMPVKLLGAGGLGEAGLPLEMNRALSGLGTLPVGLNRPNPEFNFPDWRRINPRIPLTFPSRGLGPLEIPLPLKGFMGGLPGARTPMLPQEWLKDYANAKSTAPVMQLFNHPPTTLRPFVPGTGGGGGGNWQQSLNAMSGGMSNFHSQMMRMSTSLGQVFQPFIRGLQLAEVSIAAFVAFSLHEFSKFDDQITRIMTHTQDWTQKSKPFVQEGLFSLAAKSPVSINSLATGYDKFASSGMNAAMAMQAVGIAERFALASNMDLTQASTRLIDIQHTLGLASQDVTTHFKNMKEISDLIVGTAPMVNSTQQQLTEALGGFAQQMRQHNISLRDGIALLGVYSQTGEHFKGFEGGEKASRAIREITSMAAKHGDQWRNQAHIMVWDQAGVMDVMGTLEGMGKAFSGLTDKQIEAKIQFMQLGPRTLEAVLPMIRAAGEVKRLKDQMELMSGVTGKVAEVMGKDFANQVLQLYNAIKVLGIEVGQVLAPGLQFINTQLQSLFGWFQSLNPVVRQTLIIVFLLGAAFVAVSLALAGLVATAGGGLLGLLVAWLGVIAVLGPPIATALGVLASLGAIPLMVGALGALATVFVLLAGAAMMLVLALPLVGGLLGGLFVDLRNVSWEDMQKGTKEALTNIIGFFYNFMENMQVLTKWLDSNWSTMLTDMLKASVIFLMNLFENTIQFMKILREMWMYFIWTWLPANLIHLYHTFRDLLYMFVEITRVVFDIIGEVILITLKPWFAKLAEDFINLLINGLNTLPTFIKIPAYTIPAAHANPKKEVQQLLDKSGPLIETILKASPIRNEANWGALGTGLSMIGKVGTMGFTSLLSGFTPALKSLPKFNLGLPGLANMGMPDWIKKLTQPSTEPGDVGNFREKQGPGFEFKQISSARYLLGGPAAESLDYQQLVSLRAIQKTSVDMLQAIKGIQPSKQMPAVKE